MSVRTSLRLALTATATAFLVAAVCATSASASPPRTFVASPDGTGQSCSDTVPCSLATAWAQARAAAPDMSGDLAIELRGGTYHLGAPITLDAGDSGQNGHRIIWRAAQGQRPVLSGGTPVTGWTRTDGGVWKADVPSWVDSRQLYIDGRRAQRAGGPASLLGAMTRTDTGYTITKTAIDDWSNISDTELVYTGAPGAVVGWEAWVERRCGIASVSGTTITMKQPCFGKATSYGQQGIGVPTSIENNLALLTQQGQWYLDRSQHVVYYKPRSGEDMHRVHAVIPTTQGLLQADGVHDVTVSGLGFEYDTWLEPSGNGGFPDEQADAYGTSTDLQLPPGAVAFHGARNVVFQNNTLKHLGAQGLVFDQGSRHNLIQGNEIADTSANGIDLGTVSTPHPAAGQADADNTVTNNYLHDLPAEYHGGVGIFAGYVSGTTISHNEIARTPYTGISVGWGWGATSDLGDNHVTDNYIHDVMSSGLLDGGAIYLNGLHAASPRSTVSGNYVTGSPEPYGELYLDGSVSNYDVTGNVVGNTSTNWIYIQTISGQVATDNTVTGNYSDTDTISSGWDPSNTVADNHTGLSTWPAPAQAIIRNAGLQPPYSSMVGNADAELAHAKAATASSGDPSAALDGDDSTNWVSADGDGAARITVDLGASQVIDRVQLVTRRDADHPAERQNFRILLSNQPAGGTVVAEQTSPELPFQAAYSVPVLDHRAYRYLTVEKTDGAPLSIAELRAYGH